MDFKPFVKAIKLPLIVTIFLGIVLYLCLLISPLIHSFTLHSYLEFLVSNLILLLLWALFPAMFIWSGYAVVKKLKSNFVIGGAAGAVTAVLSYTIPTTVFLAYVLIRGAYEQGNSAWNGFALNTGMMFLFIPVLAPIAAAIGFVLGTIGGFIAKRK